MNKVSYYIFLEKIYIYEKTYSKLFINEILKFGDLGYDIPREEKIGIYFF